MKLPELRSDAKGFSLLEVMGGLIIFAVVVLGLTAAGVVAGRQLRMARTDIGVWTAVHSQMETLTAQGYDKVTSGSATVQGYPMTWDVQGTDPTKVILVVKAENSQGVVVPDTFVTYIADRSE